MKPGVELGKVLDIADFFIISWTNKAIWPKSLGPTGTEMDAQKILMELHRNYLESIVK